MIGLLWFVLAVFVWPFRSNARREAETAVLRHFGPRVDPLIGETPAVAED